MRKSPIGLAQMVHIVVYMLHFYGKSYNRHYYLADKFDHDH